MKGELAVAADEVGVEVRLDDVADGHALGARLVEVEVDVALRIDDRGLAAARDEVRGVREAAEVMLAEEGTGDRGRGTGPPERGFSSVPYLHVMSYVHVGSPSVWHFVSTTVGSVPPWR